CPDDWLVYNRTCYFFSRDYRTWDQAQARCSELGVSLAVPKDEEMEFFFCISKKDNYWLGLQRQNERLQWVDGSNFNSSIEGEGDCVFLGNGGFWRGKCSNLRPYICSRPLTRL
ncbi:CLC2L protein, partial [Grantiella picta]|nr:CLC2L protein [Grantiella picta]